MAGALVVAVGVALAACLTAGGPPTAAHAHGRVPVWIITHAWHTGIAFRQADLAAPLDRLRADFPGADSLEIGWGNRDYWMSPEPTLGQGLRAALVPSPSTIRVIAFRGPIDRVFVDSDILEIEVSRPGLGRLAAFVSESFATDGAGAAIPLGQGPGPQIRWYVARGRYHALNNSNTWTAKALATAGVPIRPALALTASNVLCQAGPFARIVRLRPDTTPTAERGFC